MFCPAAAAQVELRIVHRLVDDAPAPRSRFGFPTTAPAPEEAGFGELVVGLPHTTDLHPDGPGEPARRDTRMTRGQHVTLVPAASDIRRVSPLAFPESEARTQETRPDCSSVDSLLDSGLPSLLGSPDVCFRQT